MPSLKLISWVRGKLVVPLSQPSMNVMVGHKIKVFVILLLLGVELKSMVVLKVLFKVKAKRQVSDDFTYVCNPFC